MFEVMFVGVVAYLCSLVWQILGFGVILKSTKNLSDSGWSWGRVVFTLMVALPLFWLAHWLPINTAIGVLIGATFIGLGSLVNLFMSRRLLVQVARNKWRVILGEEVIFLGGVLLMLTMRSYLPNLDSLEKYMDFGFINQYLLTPKLPIEDMWFAGEAVNYYSFGHYWSSVMMRLMPFSFAVSFNVILAIILGFSMILSFSAAASLISNKAGRWWGAITGSLLVCFGGNSHIWYFLLKNRGLWQDGAYYWYGVATRFIDFTIHEFPSYTFVIGDLHAHLITLPICLLFVNGLMVKNKYWEYFLGLLLGVMLMSNTWDAATYLFLLVVMSILELLYRKLRWVEVAGSLAKTVTVSLLVSAIWWLNFAPITTGLRWVSVRSPWWQLLSLWGVQLLFGGLAYKFSRNEAVRSMIIVALAMIAIPEIFYFVDIYRDYPRANTMFKFTFQAFVMLSLVGGVLIGETVKKSRGVLLSGLLILVAGLLIWPITAYPNFYLNFKDQRGLDGVKWYADWDGDRYEMVQFLKENRDGKTLAEYPGRSFSLDNAVPVFSGVRSILGWQDHEWLWRADREKINERVTEIQSIYESPESRSAEEVVLKYDLGWVVVGLPERKIYDIDRAGLEKIGRVVWERNGNYLIKIN